MRAAELVRASGLSYRQFDYAVRCGLIHPIPGTGTKSGRWREFTADEAAVVVDAGQLVAAGVTPAAALALARAVHADGRATLGPYVVAPP